jgi:DNA-binding CsgD family transcriptional regulator
MGRQFVLINKDPVFPFADFRLPPGEYTVGRGKHCQIAIFDATISREHARIVVQGSRITVTDLGSRNGTFVDDAPVRSQAVAAGRRLRFGRVEFLLDEIGRYAGRPDQDEIETADHRDSDRGVVVAELRELLTPMQLKVMACLLQGHSNQTIATHLGLSKHTVQNHARGIYHQLHVSSRTELLAKFIQIPIAELLKSVR